MCIRDRHQARRQHLLIPAAVSLLGPALASEPLLPPLLLPLLLFGPLSRAAPAAAPASSPGWLRPPPVHGEDGPAVLLGEGGERVYVRRIGRTVAPQRSRDLLAGEGAHALVEEGVGRCTL
eukprot:1143261-Prymnesium_polylepis.1